MAFESERADGPKEPPPDQSRARRIFERLMDLAYWYDPTRIHEGRTKLTGWQRFGLLIILAVLLPVIWISIAQSSDPASTTFECASGFIIAIAFAIARWRRR